MPTKKSVEATMKRNTYNKKKLKHIKANEFSKENQLQRRRRKDTMKIKSPKLRLRWKKWTKFDWKSQFDRTVSVKQGLIADEETLEAVTGGDDGTGGDGDEAKINKQITV